MFVNALVKYGAEQHHTREKTAFIMDILYYADDDG